MNTPTAESERFEALFRSYAHRVRGYVRRRIDVDQVDEVVAETFLTAWRRFERLPEDEPLPWLLVTARHIIANTRRSGQRGESVHARLDAVAAAVPAVDGPVVDRAVALNALAALTDAEREAVLLVAWDGLDNTAAAAVAGCSVRAFTVRLHRARLRLGRELAAADDPATHKTPMTIRLVEETR